MTSQSEFRTSNLYLSVQVGTVTNITRNPRFALNSVDCDAPLAVLNGDLFGDDDIDSKAAGRKAEWESRFGAALSDVAAELAYLESVPCCLTFSAEDAARSWHGRDGQPMPLWTAPSSASAMAMTDSGSALASTLLLKSVVSTVYLQII